MSDRPAAILLAEPEEAVRESVEIILTDEGYDCQTVCSAFCLIQAIRRRKFDLIITDISMVYGHIENILSSVKRHSAPPPPILITLSYERIGDMLTLTKSGVNEYLLKPFQFEDLIGRIQKIIT